MTSIPTRLPHRPRAILFGATVAVLVFAVAGPVTAHPAAGRAAADPDTSISSDGKIATAPESAVPEGSAGYPGDGKPGGDNEPHGADRSPTAAAAKPDGMGTMSVIPPDTRTRVDPTTVYPASATVWLTRTTGGTTREWCSGWMYAPDMVATAGHCVHGGQGRNWIPSDEIRVWPGRNATSGPYGSCTVRAMHTVLGWSDHSNPDYDYGAITLNCTIGNSVGWYGWWWQTASLAGTDATVSGYPFDKDVGTQWRDSGHIDTNTDRQVLYFHDTWHGQSGSPVYQNRPPGSKACSGYCVMGIHAYGTDQYHPRNAGTRIVKKVAENLRFWRDEN